MSTHGGTARRPSASSAAATPLAAPSPATPPEVYGQTTSTNAYAVYANGNSATSGSKSFVQPHPTDPTQSIRFICLEGNESGTYFRGTARLVGGSAEIAIPQEWQDVTSADGITVQITPIGAPAVLYVAEKSRSRIIVRGQPDVEFDYTVNGVRRGFASYEPYIPNSGFVPTIRGVPFGTQWPDELRDILVANGILNPDYTPNEQTAARLGWTLVDPSGPEASSVPPEFRQAQASAARTDGVTSR